MGLKTRYDGTDKLCQKVKDLVSEGVAVAFCPEQGGGLPTPRKPAEIAGGDGRDVVSGRARVLTEDGQDVTTQFLKGARGMLELAKTFHASKAILKALSPSCGVGAIYDGTFSGNIMEGDGVATALLKESGLKVVTEEEFKDD